MNRGGMNNFLSLNRSLTNLGGEIRQFRLPRINPFPKLDSSIVRSTSHGMQRSVSRPVARGSVIIEGDIGHLPEVATDVIDVSANYAVENVKRERSNSRAWSRVGFVHLIGRMLSNHRAARP